MSNLGLAVLLFLQLSVILGTCRLVGWLGRRFLGQTQVVMEMVAGVLLGPSFFGVVAPALQARLFPRTLEVATAAGAATVAHPAMAILFALSQLGLVCYMFLIGLELDLNLLRGRVGRAGLISGVGIGAPFALGGLLAVSLVRGGDFFLPQVGIFTAVLYLGASMSITAFPMLARILHERGLSGTRLGTLTLTAGATDDAVAWCLLAVVLATLAASPWVAIVTVGGGALYALAMLTLGRRALARFAGRVDVHGGLSIDAFTAVVLVLMASALVADLIGIYAVFGAFVCGAAMPRGRFAEALQERIEPLTVTLLLPIFFVFSGLNTRIGLVDSPRMWAITAVVVLFAILGKGVACALTARVTGETWRDAAAIGTLMNARGLMELIILNVGLDRGVITPTLFTIMVLMAVVTTVIASPVYNLVAAPSPLPAGAEGAPGGR